MKTIDMSQLDVCINKTCGNFVFSEESNLCTDCYDMIFGLGKNKELTQLTLI